jgi:hypothetical protein
MEAFKGLIVIKWGNHQTIFNNLESGCKLF